MLFAFAWTVAAVALSNSAAWDATAHIGAAPILTRYVSALEAQRDKREAVSMQVSIDASLPRLKRNGRLHALRLISRLGKVVYSHIRFEGDNLVKKQVIANYLRAEQSGTGVAVTPANYKFRYKGTAPYNDRTAYVFDVTPHRNRPGTYKGEVWIDSATFLPLRQWGVLARNPSFALKRVYFVSDYANYRGVQVPTRLIINADTWIAGRSDMVLWFDNFKVGVAEPAE